MEYQMEEEVSSEFNPTINDSTLGNNSELFLEYFLEDLDSTWDDVSQRLTVSRMVSDSLIKGMVTAILDESNEKLACKEEKIGQIDQELEHYKMVRSELNDKELQEKRLEDLSVIKNQLGDLLEFFSGSELGCHIANNERDDILKMDSEECIDEIFSNSLKLNCMKTEDLISYLKEEITKMKRGHDTILQQKTEDIYVLKREVLKEKGSNPLQCENTRKKIYKLVNKLDEILLESHLNVTGEIENHNEVLNEKLDEIRVLDQENQELRGLFAKKENELEELKVCSVENLELRNLIAEKEKEWKIFGLNLKTEFGIEAEIREEIQKTVLKGRFEEFEIKLKEEISRFNFNFAKENELHVKNKEEREKLRQEIDSLSKLVQEKENFASQIELKFTQLNQNFNSLIQYSESLREKVNKQDDFISNRNRDFHAISFELDGLFVKSNKQEEELNGLKEKFMNISNNLDKEKLGVKINGNWVELINGFIETMLSNINNIEWSLINNVECAESRISIMKIQFDELIKEAKYLKNEKEWYKNTSEITKANLCKAESEVDMLGDEVETLTYLLQKTFGVLKHYSYVFQHYPGVNEILKSIEKHMNAEPSEAAESISLLTPK